jgi:hypothetical protein
MRKVLLFVAVVAAVAAWLSFDRESSARQRLGELWAGVQSMFAGEPGKADSYNWGDVAEKVGEFAREERGLREVLGPGRESEPAPAAEAPAAAD